MALEQSFVPVKLEDLLSTCSDYKEKGYRLSQMHPVMNMDESITLVYTFVKGCEVVNLKLENLKKHETVVPSVTGMFLQAFFYENEAYELYGIEIEGNAIDFKGNFYKFAPGVDAPMTIISPAQLAARQKAARIKAAKLAKEKAAAAKTNGGNDSAALEAEIAAKTAGLDPEKAAKVRAAMMAKAKKDAAKPKEDPLEAEIAAKTAGLDPEKAAKVRAGIIAKAKRDAEKAKKEALEAEIAAKTEGLDPEKAAKVRAAMEAKAAREAQKAEQEAKEAAKPKTAEIDMEALEAQIEAATAGLDPDKAAKVRAGMIAKAKRDAAKANESKGE